MEMSLLKLMPMVFLFYKANLPIVIPTAKVTSIQPYLKKHAVSSPMSPNYEGLV